MKMIWIFKLTNCTFFVNVSQLHAQLNLGGKSNRPVYVFKYFRLTPSWTLFKQ